MQFKAFISYSHAADGKLAPALQLGLQRFGKAWYQTRKIRVFRDETTLSVNPALWFLIQRALEESEYFLLLASPGAALSAWTRREVEWWLANRGTSHFLILLTDGEVKWNQGTNDFDWTATSALPVQLRCQFAEEPLYVDLRWARGLDQPSARNLEFRGAILNIIATITGRPKDELDSEEIRQHRRALRYAWSAVLLLLILTLTSTGATVFGLSERSNLRMAWQALKEAYTELTLIQLRENPKEYEKFFDSARKLKP